MRIVVIGGQARKVGKTSVMTGLIRRLREFEWTAVKISRHGGKLPGLSDPEHRSRAQRDGFILTEDVDPSPATDTGRYLLAGARRALWLRVEPNCVKEAVSALLGTLTGAQHVMIESTGALDILSPDVGIIVLDRSRHDAKPNISRTMRRADAVVEIASSGGSECMVRNPSPHARRLRATRKVYFSTELCRFVRWKLRAATP